MRAIGKKQFSGNFRLLFVVIGIECSFAQAKE
jgi:hypothetical protein